MSRITQLLKQHGPSYLKEFGSRMPENHKKVLDALSNCRQGKYGFSDHICEECYDRVMLLNCCGNRHCPSCQGYKNIQWLAKQLDSLLPVNYFMITFTVPAELRELIRSNQKLCYEAMFKTSSDSLIALASDPKFIGCDKPGFFGVLHTWGRDMCYHPHIHYIVPGGGIKDGKWRSSRDHYYADVRALSKLFRGKLTAQLKKAGLIVPQAVWNKDWVVDSRAVGDGQSSLKYLAPYVNRVAISDKRIKKVTDTHVTYEYRPSKSQSYKNMTVTAHEFIRRFLQHTLPSGFMKIRYFGFMHPNCKTKPQQIREMISVLYEIIKDMIDETPGDKLRREKLKPFSCKHCEGTMIMLEYNYHPVGGAKPPG